MEKAIHICYNTAHETSRKPAGIGTAAPTSHGVARSGREPFLGGTCRGRLGEFGSPMVSGLPEKRPGRASTRPDAGPPAEAFGPPAQAAAGVASARSAGRRLSDGTLDAETHGRSDREEIWRAVSPRSCVVAFGES